MTTWPTTIDWEIDFDFFYNEFEVGPDGIWEHLQPASDVGVDYSIGHSEPMHVALYYGYMPGSTIVLMYELDIVNPSSDAFTLNMFTGPDWFVHITNVEGGTQGIARQWTAIDYTPYDGGGESGPSGPTGPSAPTDVGQYIKERFRLYRIRGQASLGVGFRLGESRLGNTRGTYETVPVSRFTMVGSAAGGGYTIGDNNEQSLDPSTASATVTRYEDTWEDPPFLRPSDLVEGYYRNTLEFKGIVRETPYTVAPNAHARHLGRVFKRDINYTFASLEYILISRIVTWDWLDEETALARLSHWFTVDTSGVHESHMSQVTILVPEADGGSLSLLDIIRDFSSVTKLPIRLSLDRGINVVEVFDNTVEWNDQPLEASPGFEDSTLWAVEGSWTATESTPRRPSSVTVERNNTLFLGGIQTIGVVQPTLGSFYLGVSRLGEVTAVPVGFRTPQVVDVFGIPMPVLRVTHTFAKDYTATVEVQSVGQYPLRASVPEAGVSAYTKPAPRPSAARTQVTLPTYTRAQLLQTTLPFGSTVIVTGADPDNPDATNMAVSLGDSWHWLGFGGAVTDIEE